MSNATVIDRTQDGISHINVWSKGKTEIGQLLSNFAHAPFTHPVHGTFASMEAFWYWLGSGKTHQELRRMYGASAKSMGTKLPTVEMPVEEFRQAIREGIRCKLEQNPEIRNAFIRSMLPFEHYFVYGRNSEVIVNQTKHRWQCDYLEELRDEWRVKYKLPTAAEARLIKVVPVHKPQRSVGDDGWVESIDPVEGDTNAL